MGAVAKEIGLVERTLRNWMRAFRSMSARATVRAQRKSRQGDGAVAFARGERSTQARGRHLKRRRASRGMRCEVRMDRCATQRLGPKRAV